MATAASSTPIATNGGGRSAVKTEITIKDEDDSGPLRQLCKVVLPFRSTVDISFLLEKLAGEGLTHPEDLAAVSLDIFESRIANHESFNLRELGDAVRLRRHLEDKEVSSNCPRGRRRRNGSTNQRGRPESDVHWRDRSRSAGSGRRDGDTSRRVTGDGGRHHRSSISRAGFALGVGEAAPVDAGHVGRQQLSRQKPDIWEATENCDEQRVQQLVEAGADVNVRFKGWTPLMKAAEADASAAVEVLLSRRADLEAVNSRGRTALSFAAAPSGGRPTAMRSLMLLLSHGANIAARDEFGLSVKERVEAQRRGSAEAHQNAGGGGRRAEEGRGPSMVFVED
eukprot:TRINITY_DN40742_c0_g1_i2.p1 TRINITY_DN40742_c0_g1~~TRINITY_DN40742_c0_g1_i2.p1  ORF type:complete len:386 (+),score=83.46 TRINITY_DN40742_c0_g1_i2:144-1160(+)